MTLSRVLSLAAVVGAAVLALAFRHALPQTMVVHWGADNLPNGYASRDVAISIIPGIGALVWGFLGLLPRAEGTARLRGPHSSYDRIAAAILLILFAGQAMIVSWNLGFRVDVVRCGLAGVAALIAVIGNYLGKLPPNSAFGLRNRWTLSSDANWRKVHRLTGRIMFVGGGTLVLATMAAPAGEEMMWGLTWSLILVAILPPVGALVFSALEAQRTR